MKIILGSQSPSRKNLLSRIVEDFETMPADIDEKAIRFHDFRLLPLLIARAKAHALIKNISEEALLITSDQVVVWKDELREKPESEADARRYLKSYTEFPAETVTSIVVTNTKTGDRVEDIVTAKAYYRQIPDNCINELIAVGKVLQAAGGFWINHPLLVPYLEKIEGTMESISGLPLEETKYLLKLLQDKSDKPSQEIKIGLPLIRRVGFDFHWQEEKVWALDLPVEKIAMQELLWHFHVPFWEQEGTDDWNLTPYQVLEKPDQEPSHWQRIQEADTSYPLDIMFNKGRWTLLDGLHRLVKWCSQGAVEVPVRKVPRDFISKIA